MRRLLVLLAVVALTGCGYNRIQTADEAVAAQWSEVVNQYQRRADLVPNLVNTVKGYAAHEERVLTEVTAARARRAGRDRRRRGDEPAGPRAVPGSAGRAVRRALAPHGRGRAIRSAASSRR